MKLFYKSFLTLLLGLTFFLAKGQGWPADYDGVMLQGFYWDSYNDTKWTNLEKQADELSNFFDLIWIPNSARSDGGMGYMPVFWFTNYNSAFGTEAELKRMINTFKQKGTGFIADVVVNHRNGNNSAWDFPAETYNGKVYDMADGSIVSNDNIWSNLDGWGKGVPDSYKGKADTGDRFDGCRDLDHTNATVQEHIKAYTSFLINELNYVGFRYDMVKGYDGKYTKIYNEYSKPQFSVGEFWDKYDPIAAWIDKTGKTSAAFDFPFKTQVNSAFNGGMNLSELTWENPSKQHQPAGLVHYNYRQYAVTFIDNHDTYRDNNKFSDNNHILAANAYMLSSPGTPCVFLRHYLDNKKAIQEMINARKSAGITNTSEVKVLSHSKTCYMAVVTGKRGSLAVKIGPDMVTPDGFTDADIYTTGNDYCIWVISDGSYVAPETSDDPAIPDVEYATTIYYDNNNTGYNPVYCYSWDSTGEVQAWPGRTMKAMGGNIYSITVPEGSNVVFTAGPSGPQTVDINNVIDGYIYTGESATDSNGKNKVGAGKIFDGFLPSPSAVLYMNGNFDNFTGDWDPTQAKEMNPEPGHYTLRNVKMNGSSGQAYFSFADTRGDWDTVNAGTRYGADSDGLSVTVIKNSAETSPSYNITAGYHNAWKIENGNYDIVVEPGTWKLTVYEAGKAPDFNVSILPPDDDDDNVDNGDNDNKDDNQNQPGEEKPGDDNTDIDKDKDKPDVENPDNGSDKDDPSTDIPGVNPGPDQPGNDNPGNDNPGNDNTDNDNPGSDKPGSGSDIEEPGTEQPGTDQPGTEEPGNGDDNNNPGNDNPDNGPGSDLPDEDDPGLDQPGSGDDTPSDPDDTGVEGIEADEVQPEFFTLQGIRVQNPAPGLYIKVTGNKREKVYIR